MNQRMVGNPMEPRGATASYDAATDSYYTRTCSQGAGAMRENIMAIMSLPKERMRVITEDVGGAFGIKTGAYPENIALLVGAKKFGRPIHWMSTRAEVFLTDNQARDIYSDVELALDDKGKFLALRLRNVANLGAYVGPVGANIPTTNFTRCLPGMYDIKYIDVATKCVFTNTIPTAPYRGAGRPGGSYAIERVVDEAARITGIDPVKLRRRNLHQEIGDAVQDRGRHHLRFRRFRADARQGAGACRLRRLQAAPPRGAKARQISRLRHLLHAGTFRRRADRKRALELSRRRHIAAHAQRAEYRPGPRHGVSARHRRTARHSVREDRARQRRFRERTARLCLGRLALGDDGRPFDRQSDRTRSSQKGKPIAATMLETGEADIAYKDGNFEVVGTDRRVSLFDVAAHAAELKKRGEIAEDLDTKTTTETPLTFPNGVHIAEVEIDPDTGHMTIPAYTAVDDCGRRARRR